MNELKKIDLTRILKTAKGIDDLMVHHANRIIVDLQDEARSATRAYVSSSMVTRMTQDSLTPVAIRVFCCLYEHASGFVIPSNTKLAKELDVGNVAVSKARAALIRKGYMYEKKSRVKNHKSHIVFLGFNQVYRARAKDAVALVREDYDTTEDMARDGEINPEALKDKILSAKPLDIYTSTATAFKELANLEGNL